MPAVKSKIPPSILLLADHLDTALGFAEDLRGLRFDTRASAAADTAEAVRARAAAIREFVETLRRLEALLIGRILTARQRLAELRLQDSDLKLLASLFSAGTAPFADAVEELRNATALDFETGDNCVTFLRQRGLPDIVQIDADGTLALSASEAFLVARRIHLGTLMDLIATFLDALDAKYDLYPEAASSLPTATAA